MSIRWFKTFLAVSRHGSFAAAAHQIGLTQAAVSLQMSSLEKELRLTLFDRSARAVVLNASGHSLVERAQELVRLYDNIGNDLDDRNLGGALNVGAIPPTFAELLPEALLSLRQSHPGIVVHVSTGVSSDLARKVELGELDAAIVGQPPFRLTAPLVWQSVLSEPLVLLAPSSARFTGLADAVAQYPFIGVSRQSWTGQLLYATLRRHRIKVNEAMELDSLETIGTMVARGFGISILPLAPSRWPLDDRVRVARLTGPQVCRDIGLMFREGQSRRALVSALHASLLSIPAAKPRRVRRVSMDS